MNGDAIIEGVEDSKSSPIEVSDEEVKDNEAELSMYFNYIV
jgi:hypothetical protein